MDETGSEARETQIAANKAALQNLLAGLDLKRQDLVEMHRELALRAAVNPEFGGSGESEKALWLEKWFATFCPAVRVERFDYVDARVPSGVRPNLVVTMPPDPSTCNVPKLWLVAHLDVVGPGSDSEWASQPFCLTVKGDSMHGRGVEDNNQAIVSALLLFEAFVRLKISSPMQLGAIFTSGALTNYAIGIGHVMEENPGLFNPEDLIVVPDYGSPNGSFIAIAEKTNIWVKVTVTGKAWHAGIPAGGNPFQTAVRFITAVEKIAKRFPLRNNLFSPPFSTFTPTLSENNSTGPNHVPQAFTFYLDLRLLPNYRFAEVEKHLQILAGRLAREDGLSIKVEEVESTPYAPVGNKESPVFQKLGKAIKAQLGVKARIGGISSVTMASTIRTRGYEAAVWGIQSVGKNKENETYSINDQIAQTKVLASMLFAEGQGKRGRPPVSETNLKGLTNKELEVGKLLGERDSNEKIMAKLNITKNTLRVHIKSIYKKTMLANRSDLVEFFAALIRHEEE